MVLRSSKEMTKNWKKEFITYPGGTVNFALRKVCAWCQKIIQEGVYPVTHGICPECQEKEVRNTSKGLFSMKRETRGKD